MKLLLSVAAVVSTTAGVKFDQATNKTTPGYTQVAGGYCVDSSKANTHASFNDMLPITFKLPSTYSECTAMCDAQTTCVAIGWESERNLCYNHFEDPATCQAALASYSGWRNSCGRTGVYNGEGSVIGAVDGSQNDDFPYTCHIKQAYQTTITTTQAAVISQSVPLVITKYTGASCSGSAVSDIWTVSPTSASDLTVCTRAAHATHTNHGVGALLLQNGFQALHLTCHNGAYVLGAYTTQGNAIASCSNEISRETFALTQSNHLASGSCADSIEGNSYRITLSGLTLPDCSAGVVGDPHLTNLRGEKFDIHDGLHRLVHFPRGASKEDALFMVDARAVDMGKDEDCYSVYLDGVKLSGKWMGDEISISSSMTGSNQDAFFMSFANERMDWPTLAKRQDTHLSLKGTMPVTVTTSTRKASGEDAMGGQELTFKVGEQNPVLVQVWSSKAHNALTQEKEVRYLNVQIKNLPDDVGDIIGLDSYSRPSDARCELVQEESDLLNFVKTSELSLLRIARPKWSASASMKEQ